MRAIKRAFLATAVLVVTAACTAAIAPQAPAGVQPEGPAPASSHAPADAAPQPAQQPAPAQTAPPAGRFGDFGDLDRAKGGNCAPTPKVGRVICPGTK